MPLKKDQIQRADIRFTPSRPDQQDTRRLRPGHFIPDGNQIVVLLELDDVGFHLGLYRSQTDHYNVTNDDNRYTQNFSAPGKNEDRCSIFTSAFCIEFPTQFRQVPPCKNPPPDPRSPRA